MSHAEALAWSDYIAKRGSLNLGRRIECSVALIAKILKGDTAKVMDFCPHEIVYASADDEVLSVMKKMGAKVRQRKKP